MVLSPDSHLGPYRIAEPVEFRKTGYVSPIAIAAVHAGLGASDVAGEWLEQAARHPGTLQFWIPIDPFVEGPGVASWLPTNPVPLEAIDSAQASTIDAAGDLDRLGRIDGTRILLFMHGLCSPWVKYVGSDSRQELHWRCTVTMRRQALAVGTVGILMMMASSLLAHHTWAVDRTRAVTVKGTVTGLNWSNPHVEIFLDVKDDNGTVEKWTAGGPSTGRMAGRGWNKSIFKPGDTITAVGYRATDGSKLMRVETIMLSNGQELALYGDR